MAGPGRHGPAWLTLGFALGLGFAYWYYGEDKPTAPTKPVAGAAVVSPVTPQPAPAGPVLGSLAEVERLFQQWGGYAVWFDDVAEFAAWNWRRRTFSDFYEVRYAGGHYYFRTIPRLTRPALDHGPKGNLPFQFTETQAMKDEFHHQHPEYDPSTEPVLDLPARPPTPPAVSPTVTQSVVAGTATGYAGPSSSTSGSSSPGATPPMAPYDTIQTNPVPPYRPLPGYEPEPTPTPIVSPGR